MILLCFIHLLLLKLDRLTLKLLDSDGDNAKASFNDSDITQVSAYNDPNSTITKEFYANTFERDRIFNLNEGQKTKVKSTNHDDGGNSDPQMMYLLYKLTFPQKIHINLLIYQIS